MVNSPLVSIIVVSYNHQQFIRENLDSIRSQTYKNIELIVADDASKDSSVKAFEQWLSENNWTAKKNYHTSNTGLAQTLNECLEKVSGKYVKIIAADDYLHPNYISECVTFLESSKLLAVFTQADLVDDKSNILTEQYFPKVTYTTVKEMHFRLMENNFVPGASLFTNMQVYNLVGTYGVTTFLEDYNLAMRMAKANILIGNIPTSLIYYRSHANNVSTKRLCLVNIHAIKEKAEFDLDGSFSRVILRNIRDEIASNNPYKEELKSIFKTVEQKNLLTYFSINFPALFRVLKTIAFWVRRYL